MKLWELIDQVRLEIGDEDGLLLHDSQITRYLNQGQRDLSQFSREVTSWSTTVGPDFTGPFSRPLDLLVLKSAYFDVGSIRHPLDVKYGIPEILDSGGIPFDLYIAGKLMYLVPTPTQQGSLVIEGVFRPEDMQDSDDTPGLADADRALVAYACWKCLSVLRDGRASIARDEYLNARAEWSILNAQQNPMPTTIHERDW